MVTASGGVRTPVRWAYLAMGVGSVGLGILGAILPLMPSTVFFIIALWFFKRSSPTFERRLLENRIIGPTLRDWSDGGRISRRSKVAATTTIWLCLLVSALFVSLLGKGILMTVGICLTLFLATRPTS